MTERCADPTCIACQIGQTFTCNATEARIRADERRLLERRTRAELAQGRAILNDILERVDRGKPLTDDIASLRRAVVRIDSLLDDSAAHRGRAA